MSKHSELSEAFRKLTTAPILGFADSSLPYILHTDASLHGLGAALYQQKNGQMKAIAYTSRGLSKCERRYPTHKLEFLALKWAITDRMSQLEWAAEQRADPVISRVIDIVSAGKRLSYRVRQKEDREVQLMLRVQDQLVIDNAVLYRKRVSKSHCSNWFFPRSIVKWLLKVFTTCLDTWDLKERSTSSACVSIGRGWPWT